MKTAATTNFQRLLRKSGYKVTTSRLLVLNILEKEKNPISAQDIIDLLGQQIDQATVYRILKTFEEKGLIRQTDLRHNHAHYEIFRNDEHHHLICLLCGKMEDVHDCEVSEAHTTVLKHSKHFSEIKQHSLEFYGVCRLCAKNEHRERNERSRWISQI